MFAEKWGQFFLLNFQAKTNVLYEYVERSPQTSQSAIAHSLLWLAVAELCQGVGTSSIKPKLLVSQNYTSSVINKRNKLKMKLFGAFAAVTAVAAGK